MHMRIVHLTNSDVHGGAARASARVHSALLGQGADSWMVVDYPGSQRDRILGPRSRLDALRSRVANHLNARLMRLQVGDNPVLHSPGVFSGSALRRTTAARPDVVNLHWLGAGLLTVREIGSIRHPVVWRLPDMWAYCGSEHLAETAANARWRAGYTKQNRPPTESGFDIDWWTWERKRRAWERPYHLVAPSRWARDCASSSALLRTWPIWVIPNPLALDVFSPQPKRLARAELGLPQDVPIVVFGAAGGASQHHKGFDLLLDALARLREQVPDLQLVVFGDDGAGQDAPGCSVHWLGNIDDDHLLSMVYSAGDVVVAPSRKEQFGQIGTEAQACGTPVVAFRNTGLEDLVDHLTTGYLAGWLDAEDLARGIRRVLDGGRTRWEHACRERAMRLWSPDIVASQYLDVYRHAIAAQQSRGSHAGSGRE